MWTYSRGWSTSARRTDWANHRQKTSDKKQWKEWWRDWSLSRSGLLILLRRTSDWYDAAVELDTRRRPHWKPNSKISNVEGKFGWYMDSRQRLIAKVEFRQWGRQHVVAVSSTWVYLEGGRGSRKRGNSWQWHSCRRTTGSRAEEVSPTRRGSSR